MRKIAKKIWEKLLNILFNQRYKVIIKRITVEKEQKKVGYNPAQIANFFIDKGISEEKPITPMQAIKMTYIAHGWYLALAAGQPLINETVIAWKYGPVINSLYQYLKSYGRNPINNLIKIENQIPNVLPDRQQTLRFLEKIWGLYKKYSGIQLSNMTHAKNTPWWKTVEPYIQKGQSPPPWLPISDSIIQKHYKELLSK